MSFIATANHTTIHYLWNDYKQTETVVFINSLGTQLSIWDEVVTLLGSRYNILRFDKRGHGLSSTRPGCISIDTYADDVIFLMDALDIRQAHIVGLSIGGLITYSLASRYADRCSRLIFSNTGAKIGTASTWDERISSIRDHGIAPMSTTIIEKWLSPQYRGSHPAATQGYLTMLQQNTTVGYTQACEAIRDADFTAQAKTIQHKSMFIGGSADLGTPSSFVESHARDMNAERIEIILEVGHLPCIEAPATMADLIIAFLDDDLPQYDRGMRTRRMVLGNQHVDAAEAGKTDFDTDFQDYIVNSAWGAIWSRPHLTKRERSMITIAVLASLGHKEELEMHLRASQNTGATMEDIKEVLLHIGIYAGVPVTNGAMKTAKEVFAHIKTNNNE